MARITIEIPDARESGFVMPGEWERHECCWMAWPCRDELWGDIPATERAYAKVANAIARFERVRMLVRPDRVPSARELLGDAIELIEMSINDSWTRDSGPNFLVNRDGRLAGSAWTFNAWGGKYHPHDQDARMAVRILRLAGAHVLRSCLVAEGGAITVDGEGTLIATESCLLNKNRNPGWSKREVEEELCRTLGVSKIIWIPGDYGDAETDGHVDGIAAFIEPGRVLVEVNPDESDPHYPVGHENTVALRNQVDAKGRRLELEFIYEGIYHLNQWNGGCSSYVNSYLANGAVIVPAYGYSRDADAVETYQRLYPDREIVQVKIDEIALGGGGIHCITQQQPDANVSDA